MFPLCQVDGELPLNTTAEKRPLMQANVPRPVGISIHTKSGRHDDGPASMADFRRVWLATRGYPAPCDYATSSARCRARTFPERRTRESRRSPLESLRASHCAARMRAPQEHGGTVGHSGCPLDLSRPGLSQQFVFVERDVEDGAIRADQLGQGDRVLDRCVRALPVMGQHRMRCIGEKDGAPR
jgi:hypothetical protein